MSGMDVMLRLGRMTRLGPRVAAGGAWMDVDDVLTIGFGDGWREGWRTSALEAIDHLATALDDLRTMVLEDGR